MRLRDEMPELEGATVWYNSEPIEKKDLIGHKPTLIHFWSVSCEICKQTMRNIQEFRNNYKNELHVIAVHMPRSEEDLDLEQIKQVAEEHDITQPIFVDNEHRLTEICCVISCSSQPIFVDNEHRLTDAFNNHYVPSYYVFDKKGQLRHRQSGNGGMK